MALTPLDIHNKEFSKRFKGYDTDEVNDFLDEVIRDYEDLLFEKKELEKKLQLEEERAHMYTEMQETLNRSIVVAQEAADRVEQETKQKAEIILYEAEKESARLIQEAVQKAEAIQQETHKINEASRHFRQKLQQIIEAQLELVKSEAWDKLLQQGDFAIPTPNLDEVLGTAAATPLENDAIDYQLDETIVMSKLTEETLATPTAALDTMATGPDFAGEANAAALNQLLASTQKLEVLSEELLEREAQLKAETESNELEFDKPADFQVGNGSHDIIFPK